MTWRERIERALATGSFTEEDKDMSGSWASCAIGEMRLLRCVSKEQETFSLTFSLKAHDLGVRFVDPVRNDRPEEAMLIYKEIQKLAD